MSDNQYKSIVEDVRRIFYSGRTLPMKYRKEQLKYFLRMIDENTDKFCESLNKDLHKCKEEAILCEIELLKNELRNALYNIEDWMKAEEPKKAVANVLDKVRIANDPYGVVLIMGAWNYPMLLLLKPAVGAIAAGNCVILKPSSVSPATAELIADIVPKYLDNNCFKVVLGSIPETTELLKERFDYIMYTGSFGVGKIVREAANKHLTPTTLELGGKSPVYIDSTAKLDIAAKRIMWGKVLNSGQTCIAPDYVLCTKTIQGPFIDACKAAITEFFGNDVKVNADYGRIVNAKQLERVNKYLQSGNIAFGGDTDASQNYIEPTIITDVNLDDSVMQDEIFGPILPIINVRNIEEAVEFVNKREKPLALYVFSTDKEAINKIIAETSSGAICVNDVVIQSSCENTPFGGVGHSGMGHYNGKYTFDTFTHKKTCLYKNLGNLSEAFTAGRYPPYNETKMNRVIRVMKKRNFISFGWLLYLLFFLIGVAITVIVYEFSKTKHNH